MRNYVLGFGFVEYGSEKHVYLIRKTHPKQQRGLLNGVGGAVEPGESFSAAMDREAREEAGLFQEWECFAILRGKDASGEEIHIHVYRANIGPCDYQATPLRKSDEEYFLVPINDVKNRDRVPDLDFLIELALCPCDILPVVVNYKNFG